MGQINFRYLAEKYELTGGLIKNAVLLAAAMAVDRTPQRPAITQVDLEKAAEQQRRAGHEVLSGENIAYHENYDLRSLSYDTDVTRQINVLLAACRQRDEIWRKWDFADKFAHGTGLCALFNGSSGTGKTAAAYGIAAELGLPVRTIEFASLLSLWHGDTEHNVLRMFQQLKGKSEVVVFDECESLLTVRDGQASRTQSNIVNIFLRHLETFDGILIMTTNLKEELDTALERRILFRIDFREPNAQIREKIWRDTLPSKAPVSDGIDWHRFAEEYQFTGGQIKNCLISAMYLALSDGSSEIMEHHLRQACMQQTVGFDQRKQIGFSAVS
jgi:SpoVK/Ycf46/Vps4 family AAA+-type ATPase